MVPIKILILPFARVKKNYFCVYAFACEIGEDLFENISPSPNTWAAPAPISSRIIHILTGITLYTFNAQFFYIFYISTK